MGIEIERKFLVRAEAWRSTSTGRFYRQGYLSTAKARVVRVRTIDDKEGYLTVKGKSHGAMRLEFEYAIPVNDARQMLEKLCLHPLIEKTRYTVRAGGHLWEIDEFAGANKGLILAEVELADEHQPLELPAWVDREVTGDPRYFNAYLIKHPYTRWKEG